MRGQCPADGDPALLRPSHPFMLFCPPFLSPSPNWRGRSPETRRERTNSEREITGGSPAGGGGGATLAGGGGGSGGGGWCGPGPGGEGGLKLACPSSAPVPCPPTPARHPDAARRWTSLVRFPAQTRRHFPAQVRLSKVLAEDWAGARGGDGFRADPGPSSDQSALDTGFLRSSVV